MKFFTSDSIQFLKELPANNHKEWFDSQKPRYERVLKKPFYELVTALINRMKKHIPDIDIEAKDCVFRINRDVRFSKDKSPYKIYISALISENGRKDFTGIGFYIEFSAEYFRIYSGLYELSTQQIEHVRRAILTNEKQFTQLINETKFVETFGTVRGEKYKKTPKEYVSVQTDLITNKQFYFFTEMQPEFALEDNLDEKIFQKFEIALPLSTFLSEALS